MRGIPRNKPLLTRKHFFSLRREQRSFPGGKRVEKHLVTTHLEFDNLTNANVPLWIVTFCLSKAFDKHTGQQLWRAPLEQDISEQMIWMMQSLYRDQHGQVVGSNGCSKSFAMHGGVRQGRVLSPRFLLVPCWKCRWHTFFSPHLFPAEDLE